MNLNQQTATSTNNIEDVVKAMENTRTIMGFDAVLNLDLDAANKLMAEQHKDLPEPSKTFATDTNPIKTLIDDDLSLLIYKSQHKKHHFEGEKWLYVTQLKFGSPTFSFGGGTGDKSRCYMEMNFEGGVVQQEEVIYTVNPDYIDWIPFITDELLNPNDDDVKKGDPDYVDPCIRVDSSTKDAAGNTLVIGYYQKKTTDETDQKLTANVPLTSVAGEVDSVQNVKLDFSKGDFETKNISDIPDVTNSINIAIQDFFHDHDINFIIGGISFEKKTDIFYLQPNSFKITVKDSNVSKSGKILQLFIFCGDNKYDNTTTLSVNGVPEPIPEDYDISLIISNKTFFKDTLPKLKQYDKDGKEKTGDDRLDFKPAGGGTSAGDCYYNSVNVKIPVGGLELARVDGGKNGYTDYYTPEGETISVDVSFKSESGKLAASFSGKKDYPYKIDDVWYAQPSKGIKRSTRTSDETIKDVSISVSGGMDFTVDASTGKDAISSSMNSSQATTNCSIPKPSDKCEHSDYISTMEQAVREHTPKELKPKLDGLSFEEISIFALEHILFPNEHKFQMTEVHMPADMLIVGKLIADDNE